LEGWPFAFALAGQRRPRAAIIVGRVRDWRRPQIKSRSAIQILADSLALGGYRAGKARKVDQPIGAEKTARRRKAVVKDGLQRSPYL
jgi:hypothetical protein